MQNQFKTKIQPKQICPSCGKRVLNLHSGRCIQCKCNEIIPQIQITRKDWT